MANECATIQQAVDAGWINKSGSMADPRPRELIALRDVDPGGGVPSINTRIIGTSNAPGCILINACDDPVEIIARTNFGGSIEQTFTMNPGDFVVYRGTGHTSKCWCTTKGKNFVLFTITSHWRQSYDRSPIYWGPYTYETDDNVACVSAGTEIDSCLDCVMFTEQNVGSINNHPKNECLTLSELGIPSRFNTFQERRYDTGNRSPYLILNLSSKTIAVSNTSGSFEVADIQPGDAVVIQRSAYDVYQVTYNGNPCYRYNAVIHTDNTNNNCPFANGVFRKVKSNYTPFDYQKQFFMDIIANDCF